MSSKFDKYSARFKFLMEPEALRAAGRQIRVKSDGSATLSIAKDLPDDAPEYIYVGKIAIEWANLEAKIDRAISALAPGQEKLISCLTAQMIGPGPRLAALEAAYRVAGRDDIADRVAEFSSHARGVADQRNRFVHDHWYMWSSDVLPNRTVKKKTIAKGTLMIDEDELTADDFERVIYKIRSLTDIFDNYIVLGLDVTNPFPTERSTE